MSFQHRLAVRADLAAIVAIYNATIASREVTADTEPVTVAQREAWFEAHPSSRRPLWVVEEAGEVVAWLSFSDFYGRPAYAPTAEISLYIHPEQRRRGLGRYLLQAAIDHAPSLGVHTLLGFVFGHNRPSLALFEAFGFSRWGWYPRVAVLDGVERDLAVLGLRLGDH
ncbi:GNAT family N-acetyltransferase [Chitinimonas lacunae]|uniref:GNAT family N-acetyltransferase n=1 Tax=Chitinimonas lacunae TaxID=1963018 RepID=A0ABV8MML2_9NEIS